MNITTVVLLLSVACIASAWIDVTDSLKGRYIHIQSLQYKSKWMNTGGRILTTLENVDERDVFFKDWTQVQVSLHVSYL